MRKAKVITALSLTVVMLVAMVVFASPASACDCEIDFVKFYGTITDADDNPYVGHEVEIKKKAGGLWWSKGTNVTNSSGYYEIGKHIRGYTFVFSENDTYRMLIDNNQVAERYIDVWNYDCGGSCCCGFITWSFWSYQWNYQIPEFTTIAIPVASILGLLFFFNHRKRRKVK